MQTQTPQVTESIFYPITTDILVHGYHLDGGIILIIPEGDHLEYAAKFGFRASNNEAKYEALIKGMEMAVRVGVRDLVSYSDSQLAAQQVAGTFEAKEEGTQKYVQ